MRPRAAATTARRLCRAPARRDPSASPHDDVSTHEKEKVHAFQQNFGRPRCVDPLARGCRWLRAIDWEHPERQRSRQRRRRPGCGGGSEKPLRPGFHGRARRDTDQSGQDELGTAGHSDEERRRVPGSQLHLGVSTLGDCEHQGNDLGQRVERSGVLHTGRHRRPHGGLRHRRRRPRRTEHAHVPQGRRRLLGAGARRFERPVTCGPRSASSSSASCSVPRDRGVS